MISNFPEVSIISFDELLKNYQVRLAENSRYRQTLFDFSEVMIRNHMTDLPVLCYSPELDFYFYYDKDIPGEFVNYACMFCALFNINTISYPELSKFHIKNFSDGMIISLDSLKNSDKFEDMTMGEKLDILDKKNSFVVMLQKDFL